MILPNNTRIAKQQCIWYWRQLLFCQIKKTKGKNSQHNLTFQSQVWNVILYVVKNVSRCFFSLCKQRSDRFVWRLAGKSVCQNDPIKCQHNSSDKEPCFLNQSGFPDLFLLGPIFPTKANFRLGSLYLVASTKCCGIEPLSRNFSGGLSKVITSHRTVTIHLIT